MKMSPESVQTLRSAIGPLDTEASRQRYRAGDPIISSQDRRYRWSLYWMVASTPVVQAAIGGYIKASELNEVLASIVPPLKALVSAN